MTLNVMTSLLYTAILWPAVCVGSPTFVSARVGSSAVLPCQLRNASTETPHVQWRNYAETVFERFGQESYEAGGYKDRVDVPEDHLLMGNCSLVLNNIRTDDAGLYESYLILKTGVRSKRAFIQSVELSVEASCSLLNTEHLILQRKSAQTSSDMSSIMTSLLCTTATLLLTTCVGSLYAQTQIFMSARVGSSAVLPCDWRNVSSQNPHVEWRTYAETVFERMGEALYQGEGYEDRVDVPEDHLLKGNCSLELKNVRLEDAGVYESFLLVRRKKRSLRSKRVFLQRVELSVDETPEESVSEKIFATDDAGLNGPHLQILVSSLLLCLVFCFF
ncbi:hypothetical protein MHYP_G00170560 [Metynnis hypsauchen]